MKNKKELLPIPVSVLEINKHVQSINDMMLEKHANESEITVYNKQSTLNPLVKKVTIESYNNTEMKRTVADLQSYETFESLLLLYKHMYDNGDFHMKRVIGKELVQCHSRDRHDVESIHNTLSKILSYTAVKVFVKNPVSTGELSVRKGKYAGYRNVSVVSARKGSTKKVKIGDTEKEMIVELKDVSFMEDYLDIFCAVRRYVFPMKDINKVKHKNRDDKKRMFLTKVCYDFARTKNTEITKTLEECMKMGYTFSRWKSEKKVAWKAIIRALQAGQKEGLLSYIFEMKDQRVLRQDQLDEKDYKNIAHVIIRREYSKITAD